MQRRTTEKRSEGGRAERLVRDKPFAVRLQQACEGNPHCPTDEYRGKKKWVRDQLIERFEINVSPEAVRNWFDGVAVPRRKTMSALARALDVNEGWLSLGIKPDFTPSERIARDAMATGMTNAVTGFMQIGGITVSFPNKEQKERNPGLHVRGIIDGEYHNFEIVTPDNMGGGKYKFFVSDNFETHTVLGALKDENTFSLRVFRFTSQLLKEHGQRPGDYWELRVERSGNGMKVGNTPIPEIVDFRNIDGIV